MSSDSRPLLRSIQYHWRPATGERLAAQLLEEAGIHINGEQPWDVRVNDSRFYWRLLNEGTLGAGEAYMDGWWDAPALDECFEHLHRARTDTELPSSRNWLPVLGKIINRQTRWLSESVVHQHYDLGNDLYEAMLGPTMQYTCAYWKEAETLDQAQRDKLKLICRKLELQPGQRVLELGGGFGELARFMAAEYGCDVVSYNLSGEQVRYGRALCEGLNVRFEHRDYREAVRETQLFDRVVSIGLCEHVGYKNYRSYLRLAHEKLRPGGLFLLHTIGSNYSVTSLDPWIDKYIFPGGMLPSAAQLTQAMEHLWIVEDWHNFGPDYDRTLMAWWDNFQRDWPALMPKYGQRFYRMWKYYLLSCAGGFRARAMQLWQLVLSKGDRPGYVPVR